MISLCDSNFIEKLLWESDFSNLRLNRLFGCHFETVQLFFFWNMVVISVYVYSVEIIRKFRWENSFLRGVHGTPCALTEVRGTLCS